MSISQLECPCTTRKRSQTVYDTYRCLLDTSRCWPRSESLRTSGKQDACSGAFNGECEYVPAGPSAGIRCGMPRFLSRAAVYYLESCCPFVATGQLIFHALRNNPEKTCVGAPLDFWTTSSTTLRVRDQRTPCKRRKLESMRSQGEDETSHRS